MTDPNDSEGSWEFVDKDADSETSSVASAYDTGLPEDVEETTQNQEELVGSAWNNKDEFITDSDIEACAEDPGESDNEGETTITQAAAGMSESEHGAMPDSLMSTTDTSSETLTKSKLENSLPDPENTSIDPEALEQEPNENSVQVVNCDDLTQEVVTSQENINASRSDDIIQVTDNNTDFQLSVGEVESPVLSNVSSHSDFERIASSSDLMTSEPETEETSVDSCDITEPKTVEDFPHSDKSEDGSVDFTVISAPASPPVEIASHETDTSSLVQRVDVLPANEGDVGMTTELEQTCQERVDAASGPDEVGQNTVGMVTDHHRGQQEKLTPLLMSILFLTFGAGFILGRCPLPPTALYKEHYAPVEKTDVENSPLSIQHIYHGGDQPPTETGESFDYEDSLLSVLSNALATNGLRYRLKMENSALRNRNRRLRSTIGKLKSENSRTMKQQTAQEITAQHLKATIRLLKETHRRQQLRATLNLAESRKNVQQMKTKLSELEHGKASLNQIPGSQKQQPDIVTSQKASDKHVKAERTECYERLHGVRLRLQRYRKESKGLIQLLAEEKNNNLLLKSLARQSDMLNKGEIGQTEGLQSLQSVSPLVKALTDNSQTCLPGSKSRSQVKWLRSRLKGQKLIIRKLRKEKKLKALALEKLYNSFGELSNYAMCLGQQILILPPERAKDAPSICRLSRKDLSSSDQGPSVADEPPQCFYPINGTLAVDFSTINITFQTSKVLPPHELTIISSGVNPTLTFNSSTLKASMCSLTFNPNMTSNAGGQVVPKALYAQALGRNSRMKLDLQTRNAALTSLRKVCEANNRSLDVTRKEVENVENQLVVIKNEVKRLRKEKKELNKKLNNVTSELRKKSSVKGCIASALNTDELLKQVNGSKPFKVASKMANQVKNAGEKAWKKFKKFVKKFGESKQDGDFEEPQMRREDRKMKRSHSDWKDGKEGQETTERRKGKERKTEHKSGTMNGRHEDETRNEKETRKDVQQQKRHLHAREEKAHKHGQVSDSYHRNEGKKVRIYHEFNATDGEDLIKGKWKHKMEQKNRVKDGRKESDWSSTKKGNGKDHEKVKLRKEIDQGLLFGPINRKNHHSEKSCGFKNGNRERPHEPYGPANKKSRQKHKKSSDIRKSERQGAEEDVEDPRKMREGNKSREHRREKTLKFKNRKRQALQGDVSYPGKAKKSNSVDGKDIRVQSTYLLQRHEAPVKRSKSGEKIEDYKGEKQYFDEREKKLNPTPREDRHEALHLHLGSRHGFKERQKKTSTNGIADESRIDSAESAEVGIATQIARKTYHDFKDTVSDKSFSEIWGESGEHLVDQDRSSAKELSDKSFSEIWGEFGEHLANQDRSSTKDPKARDVSVGLEEESDLGFGLYPNISSYLFPAIEIPDKLELPAWRLDDGETDFNWLELPMKQQKFSTEHGENMDGRDDASFGKTDVVDAQRFHARCERSGEHLENHHDDGANDNRNTDWFLRMFEERSRLRFENAEDRENWYFKMFEARDQERSRGEYQSSWFKCDAKEQEEYGDHMGKRYHS